MEAKVKRNLETVKRQVNALRKEAGTFKECLKYKVCPRCGERLRREPKNWGFFDIFNPFCSRHYLYTCYSDKCDFEFKKQPETNIGPM